VIAAGDDFLSLCYKYLVSTFLALLLACSSVGSSMSYSLEIEEDDLTGGEVRM
jgi:hypothetical protein